MLRDLEFFKTKLQHIDGFGDTADELVEIIRSKQVKSSPAPSEKRSSEEKPAEATEKAAFTGTEVQNGD